MLFSVFKKKQKNPLKVEVVKKPCAYMLHVETVLDCLQRISLFFEEQKIIVEKLQLYRYDNGNAMIVVNCLMDKTLVDVVPRSLIEIRGVMELKDLVVGSEMPINTG